MPNMFADRVKETTTTTGTGAIALAGAVVQFSTFTSRFAVDAVFYYAIVGQTGAEWEVGKGHLSGASTLVRDLALQSSNADAFVAFSAGVKDVFLTIPSLMMNNTAVRGKVVANMRGHALP